MARTGDFEIAGKSAGNAISTADAGSATPWDTLDGTPTYAAGAAHGSLCFEINGQDALYWTNGAGPWPGTHWTRQTDHYGRFYIKPHSIATLYSAGLTLLGDNNYALYATVHSSLVFNLLDTTGSLFATSTTTLPVDAWSRIEYHVVHGATGACSCEFRIFTTPDSATITETMGPYTSMDFDTGCIGLLWGAQKASTDSYFMDDLVGEATTWVGPVAAPSVAIPLGYYDPDMLPVGLF